MISAISPELVIRRQPECYEKRFVLASCALSCWTLDKKGDNKQEQTYIHGSGVNKSKDRRIGFVIQSYIGTNVKQVIGKNGVQLARGIDKFNYHHKIKRPNSLMNKKDLQIKKDENINLQNIFYKGSSKKGVF